MSDLPVPGSKRRRLKGSCDFCKQRKSDSSQMPGNRCSNCISFNLECTHDSKPAPGKNLGSSKTPPFQTPLDPANTSKSAKDHVATIAIQATAYIRDDEVRRVLLDVALYAQSLEKELAASRGSQSPSLHHSAVSSGSLSATSPSSNILVKKEHDDIYVDGMLAERFDRFKLDSDYNRYYGKSSHFELINTAIDVKENLAEDLSKPETLLPPTRRQEFWLSPWEHEHLTIEEPVPLLQFPEPDLLRELIDLYFIKVNIVAALLHRPIFEKSVARGLHFIDHHFGETVLGVCAIAARFSDDPRVILEGTNTKLSSGWHYYRQIRPFQKSLVRPITLWEAQTLCLCVLYMQGGSTPDMCWGLGGAGLRYVQELGIHRRNRYDDKILDEQWKRVFWVLICIDAIISSFCGRPRATSSEDYDLDYPADCDDEYWETEDPSMAFKQPEGKPSTLSYMIAYLKLIEIMGMAQETIYRVRARTKSEEWIKNAVTNLDSALNAWADNIPDHLRWDPNREDRIFAEQSAFLYSGYYHIQIQVHRIFLVTCKAILPCPLASNYPSLAICASSARACSHIMDVTLRKGILCNPYVLNSIFDSCILLLLNVWGGRKVGIAVDPKKCLQDINLCLRVFRAYEKRWQVAGRFHDTITELMNAANMEVPYEPNQLKRGREVDSDSAPAPDWSTSNSSSPRTSVDRVVPPLIAQELFLSTPESSLSPPDLSSIEASPGMGVDPQYEWSLPMYTEDLGRLPVYEPLNWGVGGWAAGKDVHLLDGLNLGEGVQPMSHQSGGPTASINPSVQGVVPNISADSLATLSEIPGGYDWHEWGKYITSVEELLGYVDGSRPSARF